MEECCGKNGPGINSTVCPLCGQAGAGVGLRTVKNQLIAHAMIRFEGDRNYLFCSNPDCQVVYFSGTLHFSKDSVRGPVYQKDRKGSTPVCYCIGITRDAIRQEILETGNCTAAKVITAFIQKGLCACEWTNPQGSCCLGNVREEVKAALAASGL